MASQVSSSQPVDETTEALFEQIIVKHVSRMKEELMLIQARDVASLEKECDRLRQQLSMLQRHGDSEDGCCDNSAMTGGGMEATAVLGKSKGGSFCHAGETDPDPTESQQIHRKSSHILIPELGVARMGDSQACRVRAMLERKGWQADLQKVVLHPAFETIALFVVTLNVVILGVETNQLARAESANEVGERAFLVELGCCVFFIIEVTLRMLANFRYFFEGPGWVLNWLDFFLVAMQSFEMFVSLVFGDTSKDHKRTVNFAMWRVLRLARIVRLFRSARLLIMLSEVRSTALAVILALKPLCGAMIVMLLLCYGFSIIFIELAHGDRLELESSTEFADIERRELLKYHFGSIGSAIITLLHCSLTSSASYGFKDISDLFAAWWVHDILMPSFMVLSMLGMLNIITGIFVDSTNRQIVRDQQDVLESIAHDAFEKVGRRRSDHVKHEDFVSVVDSGHCDPFLDMMELDKRDVRNLWSLICWEIDHDHQMDPHLQVVQVDALVNALVKMSGTPRRIDLLMILGMLEELATTADDILNRCAPTEVDSSWLKFSSNQTEL